MVLILNDRLTLISPIYNYSLKADSHIACRSHAVPRICLSESDLSRPWQVRGRGTAWERHGMCALASAVQRRHVGDLPAFGTVGEWQGRGRVVAGSWQGRVRVVARSRQGNGMGTTWYTYISL
jgi:hypothetical protein